MNIQAALTERANVLHASSSWGSDEDGGLMNIAAAQMGELITALQWLESYLRETPHHNAPAAANARAVLKSIRGEA